MHTSQTYEQILSDKAVPYNVAQTVDEGALEDVLDITVLSVDEEASDNIGASIVLKVVYDNISVLLTGHAEMEEQANLAAFREISKTAEYKRRGCQ